MGTDAGHLIRIQPDFEDVGQQKVDVIAFALAKIFYREKDGPEMDVAEEAAECPWAIMVSIPYHRTSLVVL
ncbi:MAG: hypothetical protein AAF609_25005 [Cyanobacteria bacterium P01_C01_bin.120]